jgi:hypothetical protein
LNCEFLYYAILNQLADSIPDSGLCQGSSLPEVSGLRFKADKETMTWSSLAGTKGYHVYRGLLSDLRAGDAAPAGRSLHHIVGERVRLRTGAAAAVTPGEFGGLAHGVGQHALDLLLVPLGVRGRRAEPPAGEVGMPRGSRLPAPFSSAMTLRLDLAKRGIPLGGMTIEGAMDLVETLLYLTYKWQQFGEGIRTVGSTMTVGCIVPGKRLAILVEQKVPFAFFVSTMLFDKVENVRGNVEIFLLAFDLLYNAENVQIARSCDQTYLSPLSTLPSSEMHVQMPPFFQSMPYWVQNGIVRSSSSEW